MTNENEVVEPITEQPTIEPTLEPEVIAPVVDDAQPEPTEQVVSVLDNAIQMIQDIIDSPITDFSEATERLLEAGEIIEQADKLDEYDPLIMQAAMKLQEIEEANQ
ncbi:hypothetical protein [Photobacterium leiognathi]